MPLKHKAICALMAAFLAHGACVPGADWTLLCSDHELREWQGSTGDQTSCKGS